MSTYTSQQPPSHNTTYVKSTSEYDYRFAPYNATNPALSLTGTFVNNAWVSGNGSNTNQRFHIDLGEAKIVRRIYYENSHSEGGSTDQGAKNFTLWGSNTADSFAELTYATDTGWTELTTGQATFDIHASADSADPKYILVTNATAYRYYAFKIADDWGTANYFGLRRVALQTEDGYEPGTLYQEVYTEIVALVDTALKDTSRTLTDVITIIDPRIIFGRVLKEIVTIVETWAREVTYHKIYSEIVLLVDTCYKTRDKVATFLETLIIVDTLSRAALIFRKTLSEVVTVVDTALKKAGKLLAEVLTPVDTLIKSQARTLSEVVVVVDTAIKKQLRVLSETIALVESFGRSIGKSFSEALTLVDTFARSISLRRTFSEVVAIVDTAIRKQLRLFSELLAIVDTTKYTFGKILTEAITVTETIKKYLNGFLVTIWSIIKNKLVSWSKLVKPTTNWSKDIKPYPIYDFLLETGDNLLLQNGENMELKQNLSISWTKVAKP